MNRILQNKIRASKTIAVLGHVNPDGDCVGSALALYNYLKDNMPEKEVTVWLEKPPVKFAYLRGFDQIRTAPDKEFKADLAVALDVSDRGRMGDLIPVFDSAEDTLNIDHHVTNPGFAADTVCLADASSACEVLFGLLERDKISKETAACLYTGIVTDTGVFKYNATSEQTMQTAGFLMTTGIPFGEIIDRAFYRKTWPQNRILGKALCKAERNGDGRFIWSVITFREKEEFGAQSSDMDGIAEQMRLTEGAECSCLVSERIPGQWKLSLRSADVVDVSAICASFGGGGHIRAAGCTITGMTPEQFLPEVRRMAEEQMRQ
ncbi:MAG: bifunctional oligoribonuclease/PAP phosphatase NrnA [Stomatobaculum sp.]|nr:bifunctional oligoribonuclease/PAP phosphatase NrnA [Stomatobaculum sp.]